MGAEGTAGQSSGPSAEPVTAPDSYSFPRETAKLLPWSHAEERLARSRNYWLATTRPDGRPHVTPVWGVWVNQALYFDGHPGTTWCRNLHANSALAVHLEDGSDVVIIEGHVEDLETDADLAKTIVDAWDAKYGRMHPDPAGSGILRLRPSRGRGWSRETLEDGTRWVFDTRGSD